MINYSFRFFVLFVAVCVHQSANAAIDIRFAADGSIATGDTIDVLPGASVVVELYAFETAPNTELSVDGLFAHGLSGTFNTGFGAVTDVSINPEFPILNPDPNPLTTKGVFDNAAGTLALGGAINLFVDPVSVKRSSILLGSFSYDTNGPGATVFRFGDPDPLPSSSDNGAGDDGSIDLDPLLFGPTRSFTYDITINAPSSVPEPSSLVLSVGVLGAIGLRIRRKRRAKALSVSA